MKTIEVRAGYVVAGTTRERGGVTYRRERGSEERIGDDGVRQQIETEKTVDHVEAVRLIGQVAKQADYALRKHCTVTTFGYFATPEAIPLIRDEFQAVRAAADAANDFARRAGSARRVAVGYVLTRLDLSTEDAAREVSRTIRETLGEILAALRAGDVAGASFRTPLTRAKGLDRLATGIIGEAVRGALESIGPAAKEIRDAIKAGEDPASVGDRMDLGAIEQALAWVSDEGIGGERGPVDLSGLDS
jgi:hypothetical protein